MSPISPKAREPVGRIERVRKPARYAIVAVVLVLAIWLLERRSPRMWMSNRRPGGETVAGPPGAKRPTTGESTPERPSLATPGAGTGEAYLEHTFRAFVTQPGLELSSGEVDRLVSDLLEFAEIESETMNRFMEETSVTAEGIRLHVPPFPVEGKAVRDLLYRRLKTDFPAKSEQIIDYTGNFLDDLFRGFGIADQSFEVKTTPKPDVFEVTWDAKVLDGQTPSRDPEGITYAGSAGDMLFSRDQIENGEYRFLAPAVNRAFPPTAK